MAEGNSSCLSMKGQSYELNPVHLVALWLKFLVSKSWIGRGFISHKHFLSLPAAAAAAKSLQLCPTLCDPIDGNPPGSPIPGILQARTLEWVAISFSNAWKWKVKVKSLSCVRLLAIPWTAAYQAPPSMGFCRQQYWSGVPLPSPFLYLCNFNLPWCHSLFCFTLLIPIKLCVYV